MGIKTFNPANGTLLKEYEEYSESAINEKISKTNDAFMEWKKTGFQERANLLDKAASILKEKKEEYARLMALEMGKPLQQGISEAEKCAWVCEYYAENGEKHLADMQIETEANQSFASFQPLGPVLAVMPWNFPFWQVFRFAAPALMAGNGALLKHASNTMGCAIEIEKIFREAGFPENLFTALIISSKKGDIPLENPHVKAVTLTGSTPVGKKIAAKAASMLKKTVLELGGSDPYIVLRDAPLEKTAEACVTARLINSGQSCIAAKRFIVEKEIYDDFIDIFIEKMKERKMGDPLKEGTDVGPQAREDLMETLYRQTRDSISKGASLAYGGEGPFGEGYYFPPTVLTGVKKGMPAFDEEVFGPLAAIVRADNENHAIELANDTEFGLGAAVFTANAEKGKKIAKYELDAGCCFVNDFVKSDPRLPFGGVKMSGYGRELSVFGIREFVNIKTVSIL